MIYYTLQLDISGGKNPNGYFEIGVIQLGEMKSELVDNMIRVERRGFGEVEVANEPYKYAKLGGDRYKLYDIISSVSPDQEMHLKFTSLYETLYAYFGVIDTKIDDDRKKINIKTYILDQYTDLLDNKSNDIKLFDETNQIVNGDFKEWTGTTPNGWTLGGGLQPTTVEKVYFNDNSAINISSAWAMFGTTKEVFQGVSNVLKGQKVSLSFSWALTGATSVRENLKCKLTLTTVGGTYDMDSSGKWIPYDSNFRITYQNQALPLDSLSEYNVYRKNSDITPDYGFLMLTFYHERGSISDVVTNLIISDVVLSTSTIELKTIKIQLSAETLVTKNEDAKEIVWANRRSKANFYSTKFHYQDVTLDSFFDGNGKPINGNLIMSDDNGTQLSDIIDFFQKPTSQSYKFELSKITIFKCEYIATKKRRFRAVCEFSREEMYYEKISDGNGGFLPPETDAGWYNTFTLEPSSSNRYLWIRTPFNGIELPWVKGAIDIGDWRTYNHTFGYYDSVTSEKQYPISASKSVEISNGIDFRELFRKVYTETHESLRGKNVYSNFLWNDALSIQETADVYLNNNTATNYVTMTDVTSDVEPKNELNKILAVHTYEFTTEPATDKEKTILKISFEDLIKDFLSYFPQCYWFVDSNKDLHIEHIKYFDRVNKARDLTTDTYSLLQYSNWEHIKDKLYSLEKYEFKNSGNIDFKSAEVTFAKIATNKRGADIKNEIQGKVISTDVAFCIENRDSLDNGIVLMIYDTIDSVNYCRRGVGQNTRSMIVNADLSISSLLAKYATYEGTWKKGLINKKGFWNSSDNYFDFITTKHVRQGSELTIKGVFLDKVIFTDLGLGVVIQRTVDYENEVTKIVVAYRYSDPFPIFGSGKDEPIIESPTEDVIDIVGSAIALLGESSVTITTFVDSFRIISERGIVWSLSANPTYGDNVVIDSVGGSGFFSTLISGLSEDTYYARGYILSESVADIAYGNELSFTI